MGAGEDEQGVEPQFEQGEQMEMNVLKVMPSLDGASYGCSACNWRPQGCGGCVDGPRVKGRWKPDESPRFTLHLDEVPTFRPNEAQWQEGLHRFVECVRHIAEPYGGMRVVPPASWQPPVHEPSTRFRTRVQALSELQHRPPGPFGHGRVHRKKRKRVDPPEGNDRVYEGESSGDEKEERYGSPYGFPDGPGMTPRELQAYSNYFVRWHFRDEDGSEPSHLSTRDIENEFWRIVESHAEDEPVEVIYGADIPTGQAGSALPRDGDYGSHLWNVQAVPMDERSLLKHTKGATGISKPWLYFGSSLTAFCWHVEDHHFLSVNCLVKGGPKVWYIVPATYAHAFEDAMRDQLPELFHYQPDLLQSLVTMLSPRKLRQKGIPVRRVVQERGDYVITFPFAYHGGFNTASNVAEAVNFAPPSWLPFGVGACERYACTGRAPSISNDRLLMALSNAVLHDSAPAGTALYLSNVLRERVHVERETRRTALSDLVSGGIKRMGTGRDSPDLEDTCCSICGRDCHLSGIICGCRPWKPTCGRHVKCKCKPARRRLLVRHAVHDLQILLGRIEELTSSKDTYSYRAGNAPIACTPEAPVPTRCVDLYAAEQPITFDQVPSELVATSDAIGPGLGRGFSKRVSKEKAALNHTNSRRGVRAIAPPGW